MPGTKGTEPMTDKPTGRFRCRTCGQEWDGSQLIDGTCGNPLCGGRVDQMLLLTHGGTGAGILFIGGGKGKPFNTFTLSMAPKKTD